eukprot:5144985-Prymnesium_polylepis.1
MPPPLLLNYLLTVMFTFFSAAAALGRATGLADVAGFEWLRLVWPSGAVDWSLLALHCACTLTAQLVTAMGYATTRAGIAGFLQMTELAWVYVLDVTVLRESTSAMASLGSAVVLGSAMMATRSGGAAGGGGASSEKK